MRDQSRRAFLKRAALAGLAAQAVTCPSLAQIQQLSNEAVTLPNEPNILEGFAARPPAGTVAGVDYYVGCPNVALTVPAKGNIPSGATIDTTIKVLTIKGANVEVSGFDLDGYTVLLDASASGTAIVQYCTGMPVVIRTVVGANANLVVRNCTLDGGSGAGDFRLVTYFGNGFCAVNNCWLRNSNLGGVHSGGVTFSVQNNLFEKFGWTSGIHTNGVYVSGGHDETAVITVTGNTFYSGSSRNDRGFPIGIGIGISLFDDGGNYYRSSLNDNTIIMDLPGSASAAVGYFNAPPATVTGGDVRNNYIYSVGGFGVGRGCIEPFYSGSTGAISASYSGNINMSTGAAIPPPFRPIKRGERN
jgi:hypothetical protein